MAVDRRWRQGSGVRKQGSAVRRKEETEAEEEADEKPKAAKTAGLTLEFDAARKIAQGLGIHLEKSTGTVEVKGDKARLLAVAERAKALFGKDAAGPTG